MKSQRTKKTPSPKPKKTAHPPAERISDAEFRRRLATIAEWRRKELATFKKEALPEMVWVKEAFQHKGTKGQRDKAVAGKAAPYISQSL